MKVPLFSAVFVALALAAGMACGQTEVDTFAITSLGDTARFWAQIPVGYDPQHPPAILIWWHQLGGTRYEMRDYSEFDDRAQQRGWIAASHFGPNDRHWNTAIAQEHCRTMLDWIAARYPFSRDSIYMIGGSMGGAAGQVWHNNHCGPEDYFIAATAGGSQILDCQLRQEQYLASGDTNRSMRAAFGGLPAERDSVAFQYHRASAIFFADTTESMHFNSLNLPVWNTWGATAAESTAYGFPAAVWDSLRRAGGADTTLTHGSDIGAHGLGVMPADSICNWLSGFSANRYPDDISINADEDDSYYWTTAWLMNSDTVFGRYGARKDSGQRLLEITLLRNIADLDVDFAFPWPLFDSLNCVVRVGDEEPPTVGLTLAWIPPPSNLVIRSGEPPSWNYLSGVLSLMLHGGAEFTILFGTGTDPEPPASLPAELRLTRAYPIPFNSVVTFEIESPAALREEIVLFDVLGRVTLRQSVTLTSGLQRIPLIADDLASGTYYARLSRSAHPMRIVLIR